MYYSKMWATNSQLAPGGQLHLQFFTSAKFPWSPWMWIGSGAPWGTPYIRKWLPESSEKSFVVLIVSKNEI